MYLSECVGWLFHEGLVSKRAGFHAQLCGKSMQTRSGWWSEQIALLAWERRSESSYCSEGIAYMPSQHQFSTNNRCKCRKAGMMCTSRCHTALQVSTNNKSVLEPFLWKCSLLRRVSRRYCIFTAYGPKESPRRDTSFIAQCTICALDDNKVGTYAVDETIREICRSVSPFYINAITSLPLPPAGVYMHTTVRVRKCCYRKCQSSFGHSM